MQNRSFLLLCFLWLVSSIGLTSLATEGQTKRVAVLYFDDHSGFNSSTGCGCLPVGPLEYFIGRKKRANDWDLEVGFLQLMNKNVDQSGVYEYVTQDEILDGMAALGLSRKEIPKNEKGRSELAQKIDADALVVGKIRHFNQERVRANVSRRILEGGAQGSTLGGSFSSGYQVAGYVYLVRIDVEIDIYGRSGAKIATRKVTERDRHRLGGARVSALRAMMTDQGSDFQLGQTPKTEEQKRKERLRPIVSHDQLRQIKFGTPIYNRTLLGIVTNAVLKKVLDSLRETIGPESDTGNGSETNQSLSGIKHKNPETQIPIGKVIYADSNNPELVYINIGSAKGVKIGQKFDVFERLVDPDSGDVLGYLKKAIGQVEVIDVQTDRLSQVRTLDGFGRIQKDQMVRLVQVSESFPKKQENSPNSDTTVD